MARKVDISFKTVFLITGFLACLWILYIIKDLILLLFVAAIFVSALSPIVEFLVKKNIPRALSISLVYLCIALIIILILSLGIVPITNQTASLIQRLSDSLNNLYKSNPFLDQARLQDQLPTLSKNIFTFTLDVFQSFISFVLMAVISFYLLLDKDRMEKRFINFFGPHSKRVEHLMGKIEIKLGAWLRGQVLLSVIVGVIVYIFLLALRVDFALPLAILSGCMEVVPIVGPVLGAVPGILVALASSPILGLIVAICYLITQQLESHIIVPQLMKRAVGLNPLLVIIAIALGSRLLGITGALLAVPIAVVIQIMAEDYLSDHEIG